MVEITPEMKPFIDNYLHITKYIRDDLLEFVKIEAAERYNSYIEYGKIFYKETGKNYTEAYKTQDPDFMTEWERYRIKILAAKFQLPKEVEVKDVLTDSVRARWVDMPGANKDFVIMHFHGGGYVGGSIDLLNLPFNIANATKVRVITVHYGLAPRHPFPEGLEYAFRAYKWLLSSKIDPQNIIFAGESAGGGLTLALLLKLRDEKISLPRAGICLSPWTDLAIQGATYKVNAKRAVTLFEKMLDDCLNSYLSGTEKNPYHPYISPIYADLTGLPPLLIHVGGLEILLSDAVQLAENARVAGVEVNYKMYPDMPHVFQRYPFSLPEVKDSFYEIEKFVQLHFNLT